MMCTPRHLRVSGNKQELVQRLVQAGWTADCGVKPVPKRRRTAAAAAQPPVEEAEDEHGEEARTGCFGDQSGFTSDEEEDREIELESESSYSDDNGDVPVKILAEDDAAGTVVVQWADGGTSSFSKEECERDAAFRKIWSDWLRRSD
jgi:hypothetical protein